MGEGRGLKRQRERESDDDGRQDQLEAAKDIQYLHLGLGKRDGACVGTEYCGSTNLVRSPLDGVS